MASENNKLRIVGVYNPQKRDEEEFPLMSYLMKVGMEAAYNSQDEDNEEDKEEMRRLRREQQMAAERNYSKLTALDKLRNMEWKRNMQEDKERLRVQQAERKKREEEVYFKGTRETKNKNRTKSRKNHATPPVVVGLSSTSIAVSLSVNTPASSGQKNLTFDLPPPPPETNAWQKRSGNELFRQNVNNDDDDIQKAISASLETYQQEQQYYRYSDKVRDVVKESDTKTEVNKLDQNKNTLDSNPFRPVKVSFNSPSIEVKQECPEQAIMGRQKNISESEEEEYDDDMSDWGSDTDKDEDVNYNSSDRKQPAHHGSQQNGTYQDIRTNVNYNRNPTYRENDHPTSDNVSAGHESQNSRYPSYRPIFGDVNTLSEKRMYQYSFQRRTNPDPPYDIGRHARSNETTNRRNVLDPNETCPYLTANSEEDWETKSNTEFLNENWEDSAEEFDENVEQIEDTEYELSDKKLTCIAVNEDCLDTDTYNIENKTVSGINQEKITPTRKFYVDDKNYIQSNNVYIDFPDDKENKVDSASDTETKVNSYDSKNDTLSIKETSSQNTVKTTVECATVTPLQGSSQSASSSTESTTSLQVSSQSASSSTENTTPLQVSSESAFSSTENTTPPLQVSSQSASSSTGNTTTSLQVSCQSASENTTTPLQISSQSESSSTENTTNTTAPVTSDLNPDSISRNTVNNPRAYMTIIYRQQIENICQIMRQQLQLLEQLKESSLEELPISLPLGSNTQKTNSEMPQTATASVGSFGSQPLPPSILGASMLPFMQLPPVFPTTLQPQPVSQSVPNSHIPLHQVSQSNQLSLPVDIINNRLNFSATQSFNARYEAALLNISGMAASNPPMSNMVPVQQKPCSAETTTQIPTHKTNLPLTPQVPPYLNFPGVFPELNFLNPSFINPQSVMFSPGLGFPLQQLSANVSSAPTIPLQQSPINALGIPLTCESSVNPQIRNNLHLPQQSNSVGNTFIQGNEVKPETVPSGTFLQQPQVRASGFNTVQFPHIMPSLLATNLGQMTQIPVIVPSVQANRNSPESHILHDIPSQQVDTSGTTSIPSLPNFPIHPSLLGMGLMSPFGPPQMQLPIPNPLALGMQPQSITMDQLREALPNANIHTGPTMAGVNSSSNSNQTVEPRGRGRLNSKEYK